MKAKYFIRGLGVGIIITALLLCIFYRKQMTDSAIIRKAKLLGMDFTGDEDGINDTVSPAAIRSTVVPEATPAARPTAIPKTSPSTGPTAVPTAKQAVKSTAKPASNITGGGSYYSFRVKSGYLSSSVAKQMEDAGIVSDAKKFDHYLTKNGYGDRIMPGKYKIPKGAGFAEIARIITN